MSALRILVDYSARHHQMPGNPFGIFFRERSEFPKGRSVQFFGRDISINGGVIVSRCVIPGGFARAWPSRTVVTETT